MRQQARARKANRKAASLFVIRRERAENRLFDANSHLVMARGDRSLD